MSEVNDVNIVFDYANYDKVGNRLSMKVDSDNAHVYTYDCLYQLTNVDYNDGNSTSYSYDSLGNRTDVNDGSSTSYLRNRLNQYYSVDGNDYIYDENGNLTNINDGEYEYVYDCENRLIEAKKDSQTVAEYGYDFAGRRISKTVYGSPNVTTKYCYDGEHVIAEYTGGTLVKKFVYGPGIDEPICMIVVAGESETVYYYHFDGLGSVAALSDVNSVIVERYSYDVFGEPNRVSALNNPYFFTGRRLDTETDNYYYRARYYKPEIGRFLQTDPIGYAGGFNLYAYCGNDPVNWIDPWGLHIMNILPMMRVPSIKWALGNQGEKGKELTREELEAEEEVINLKNPLHYVGPALAVSGQRLLKKPGLLGSRSGTSVASKALRRLLPQRLAGRGVLGTTSLGGAIGRAVPYIGYSLIAIDVGYLSWINLRNAQKRHPNSVMPWGLGLKMELFGNEFYWSKPMP